MSHYRRTRRGSLIPSRSLVAFLLVASFGILFAGCSTPPPPTEEEEFRFTEQDVARFRELVQRAEEEAGTGTGTTFVPTLDGQAAEADTAPVLDLSKVATYNAIRTGPAAAGDNVYRVTNAFLNVRSEPRITATAIARLEQGDSLELIDFVDAAWANVRLSSGEEGYVALRYIGKLVAEEKLSEEKEAFDGLWFVDFGFLNVRKDADTNAPKLGELPGQSIVRPLSMNEVWARVMFEGKEGYVAREYLSPFQPSFLVRQNRYNLPIVHYRLDQPGVTAGLAEHLTAIKNAGYTFLTFAEYAALLETQEQRDVRLEPRSVLVAVSAVTAANLSSITETLQSVGVEATLFIGSQQLGLEGITEKQMLTLVANGFDVQSGGHTGDDLRSLTNAQVDLELKQSRKLLEEMTGKPVLAIAYPVGGVNDRVMQLTAEAGYLLGLGTAPEAAHTRDQLLRLPSFVLAPDTSTEQVLSLLNPE